MRKHLLIALALAGVAGVTALALRARTPAPGAAARAFRFPSDEALTYELSLTSSDHVALSGGGAGGPRQTRTALGASTALVGHLKQRSYGAEGGLAAIGVRLSEIDRASVLAADRENVGPAEQEALAAAECVVLVRPDGSIADVRFPAGTPELVQNLLMLAVTETAVTLGEGPAWTAVETTLRGAAESQYRVIADRDQLELDRVRARYGELGAARAAGRAMSHEARGKAHAVVGDGVLRALDADETLKVGGERDGTTLDHEVHVHLALIGREAAAAAERPSDLRSRRPGELAVHADFDDRVLAQRVDGLTGDQLVDTLARFGDGGRVPDHNRFLWRATGLLRQHPELCDRLVQLYDSPTLQTDGRALVLDLLVGAGHPTAQAALRDALSRERAFDKAGYGMLYQRVGLLAHPDEATLEFARAHARAAGPEGRGPALASYGAVAGKRARRGDRAAQADVDALLDGLHRAADPAAQVDHLMAVANLRMQSLAGEVAAFARAPNARVRREAARALHDMKSDASRATLVGMAADADGEVQRQSLMSLEGRRLPVEELAQLTRVVDGGRMNEIGYEALLDVVEPDLQRPEARAVVEAVLRQDIQNTAVIQRARHMLSAQD